MKCLLLCLLFSSSVWAESLSQDQIQGQDLVTGQNYSWSFSQAKKASLVVFLSSSCPCSRSHEAYFKDFHKRFPQIDIIGIFPKGEDSLIEAKKHFQESALPFPILIDKDHQYVNLFKALKTPHVFLLNSKAEILFAGGPTDSSTAGSSKNQYLTVATEAFLQGKTILLAKTKTLGCRIDQE